MYINQRKTGIILSYASILISAVINIINVPLFLHCIGVGEYGIYQTIGSLIAYFSILDFGLPSTIVVFYSRYKASGQNDKMENVLAICLRMYIAITAAILLVGATLYFFLDSIYSGSLTPEQLESAKKVYIVFLLNIGCTLPCQILNAIITAYEKFAFLKGLTVLITIFQAITIIPIVFKFPFALSIVIVQTIFNVITILFRYFYCFCKLKVKIKLHFFDKRLFKEIVHYSFFIFLNVIVDQLFWRANTIILSIFGNSVSVAAYSITFQIAYYYMLLSTSITGVFLPKITKMVSEGTKKKEIYDIFLKVGRIQFLLLSCVLTGFILFGRQFIYLWSLGKDGFEDSYIMTLMIIIPLTFDLIQGMAQNILQAISKFYFRVLLFLGINIVSIFVTVLFVKRYGGVWCAFITGLGFLFMVIVLNVYYEKFLNLKILQFWAEMIKMSGAVICSFLLGILLNYIKIPGSIIDLGVKIPVYCLIYSFIMWKFVMNDYEKNLIKRPIKKVKNMLIAHKN